MGTHSPDLRVSHEPIAKADREPVCVEGAVAVVLRNSIHVGGVACLDRVALHALLWGDAPSIVDAVWEGGTVSEVEVCGEMECDLHEADLVLDLDHGEKEGAGGRTKGGWGGSSVSSIGRGRLSCCFSRDRPSVMGAYLIQCIILAQVKSRLGSLLSPPRRPSRSLSLHDSPQPARLCFS